jgi:hypothetical protein
MFLKNRNNKPRSGEINSFGRNKGKPNVKIKVNLGRCEAPKSKKIKIRKSEKKPKREL